MGGFLKLHPHEELAVKTFVSGSDVFCLSLTGSEDIVMVYFQVYLIYSDVTRSIEVTRLLILSWWLILLHSTDLIVSCDYPAETTALSALNTF